MFVIHKFEINILHKNNHTNKKNNPFMYFFYFKIIKTNIFLLFTSCLLEITIFHLFVRNIVKINTNKTHL